MTILTITHVMELVAEYASWVIVMHDGRVLLDGPPRQVFSPFSHVSHRLK